MRVLGGKDRKDALFVGIRNSWEWADAKMQFPSFSELGVLTATERRDPLEGLVSFDKTPLPS
jgi:hypothetical protein